MLEVIDDVRGASSVGRFRDVPVSVLAERPVTEAGLLVGAGVFQTVYRLGVPVSDACWVNFTPEARDFPDRGVSTRAQTTVRFSEPMDPASVKPFDSLLVVRGPEDSRLGAESIVVGDIAASESLRDYTYTPVLPYAHAGLGQTYHVRILDGPKGVTDLAGNGPSAQPPFVEFSIDAAEEPAQNGSFVLRFDEVDEVVPTGAPDIRGQFTFDFDRGVLVPRPVAFRSAPADRSNPVPSVMIPFALGLQTPLSPLGSKLQAVWRYADLGWSVRDEGNYNLDVVGLSWSPVGGQAVADFYEQFEIRLAHSKHLPDERTKIGTNPVQRFWRSGLSSTAPFAANVLDDPLSPQIVVHPRERGYQVIPSDRFLAASGTPLMPFPMNRGGGAPVSYTWRDTAVLAQGGEFGAGVPMAVEVGPPLFLEPSSGSFAGPARVPSVGLPLLMEFRCFPSETGLGLNAFDISLASNVSAQPNFRAFSTGGVNRNGRLIRKNPDLEVVPSGGFNPRRRGRRTAQTADNSFYIGQLDFVIRVSRAHTVWMDTLLRSPRYAEPVVEPTPENQPEGTRLVLDFRGADGFTEQARGRQFDANALNAYGNTRGGRPLFHDDDVRWFGRLQDIDGARFFQVRVSFLNNVAAGSSPVLSAIGLAFEE